VGTRLASKEGMLHPIWRVPLIALLVLDPVRVALRPENLHCDQYTSLPIVLFEREAHPEEMRNEGQFPLIYRAPWAVPLRAFFALAFLFAMLGPAAVVAVSARRNRGALWLLAFLTLFAVGGLPLLGHVLGGERARDLALWSFWLGTGFLWYAAAWIVVLVDRRAVKGGGLPFRSRPRSWPLRPIVREDR
jgi:hypothetical protein